MAKFQLNIGDTLKESLLFWLTRYLIYKATTLNNSKADKEALQEALAKTRPTPTDFDELLQIAKNIQKAGVGVYTLFYPVWLFAKENSQNPDFERMEDIDEDSVMRWLSIATSSKSDATKQNYKTALQDFFNYLSRHNADKYHFDIDLSKWQRNLKNSLQKPPAFLNDKEVDRFLDNLDSFVVHKRGKEENDAYATALYRLILKLALASGMRVSEIINLKPKDIRIDKESDIVVISVKNSKGNKYRTIVVPYSKGKFAIKKELDAYLEQRKCKEKEYLFCNKRGEKLSRRTLNAVLERYLAQLGIKKEKMGMHLLRHTHATYFYGKTKDPVLLQERLGHSDPQTTRRYIHLDDEKIRKSVGVLR